MRLFKQPHIPHSMIIAKLRKNNICRLVTVINNCPWYKSSGRNSGYEGTWFLFGGVLEKKNNQHSAGWFIKPRALSEQLYNRKNFFDADTMNFVYQHSINKSIGFSRFGDIKSVCISASLDGGFWLTDKGKNLKLYLFKNFPHYFLPEDLVKKIQEDAARIDLPVYTNKKKINYWLADHGVDNVGLLPNQSLLYTL